VSELGDLLELLHTSDQRWRTVRMAGREWRHEARLLEAFHREAARHRGAVAMYGHGTGAPKPIEREDRWALWVAPEGRVRAEFSVGEEEMIVVLRGNQWWHWSPSTGGQTNAADPSEGGSHGTGPGAALLETAGILPALSFEITGRAEAAGRSAFAVRATPVLSERDFHVMSGLHGIGSGADKYRLLVDAERGVLLRAEALLGDELFRTLEANEIGFDEELPPETFVLELAAGQAFSPPPEYLDVPLDKLVGEVAFTVFVPEHPPVAADPMEPVEPPRTATIMPAAPRWNVPLHVHLTYQLGPGGMLTLRESAEPMPVREDQELTPRGNLLVGDDRTSSPSRTNVRLRRSETHVELEAMGVSLDELVELAATLVPLPASAWSSVRRETST
jgi:hypothetical protein